MHDAAGPRCQILTCCAVAGIKCWQRLATAAPAMQLLPCLLTCPAARPCPLACPCRQRTQTKRWEPLQLPMLPTRLCHPCAFPPPWLSRQWWRAGWASRPPEQQTAAATAAAAGASEGAGRRMPTVCPPSPQSAVSIVSEATAVRLALEWHFPDQTCRQPAISSRRGVPHPFRQPAAVHAPAQRATPALSEFCFGWPHSIHTADALTPGSQFLRV